MIQILIEVFLQYNDFAWKLMENQHHDKHLQTQNDIFQFKARNFSKEIGPAGTSKTRL
jgi:hypothetical protein